MVRVAGAEVVDLRDSRVVEPGRVLRLGLASVLVLSGIKLVDFAGADYVIASGAVIAAIGFAIWAFVARLGRRRPRPEPAPTSD